MNRIEIYIPPATMADNIRLVEIFTKAEHNRSWFWRVNWFRLLGWVGALAWSAVVWTCLIALGKHLLIWWHR